MKSTLSSCPHATRCVTIRALVAASATHLAVHDHHGSVVGLLHNHLHRRVT